MKNKLKKLYLLFGLSVLMVGAQSCNDFLDKQPLDSFTDGNYWSSEANVKTFSWKLYESFQGYNAEFYFQSASTTSSVNISDDINYRNFLVYQTTASVQNTDWNSFYTTIRSANLMLSRIGNVSMPAENAKHWIGVAKFFRAYMYFQLVERFGDVPYIDTYSTNVADMSSIFVPRTPRKDVMDKVKADLDDAIDGLKTNDGTNTVNKYTALALMARVGVYEGTYRKYHPELNLDGTEFLKAAKEASSKIINDGLYTLGADFKSVYNSIDLSNNAEMILFKKYLPSIIGHSVLAFCNTSSMINGLTKAAVENYACTDGLPIGQSALYKGDNSLADVVTARDSRLTAAIDVNGYGYADKNLYGVLKSSTGYVVSLFNYFDTKRPLASDITTEAQNQTDAPVFGLAEVLLNYAEATAELGGCTNADLDKSVNKLRLRAGLPKLTTDGTNASVNGVSINDPKRTAAVEKADGGSEVSPLIWEIRRDRRAELMTWTYIRYYDLMRWHRGQYLDFTKNPDVALGAKLVGVPPLATTKVNADGYIISYPNFTRTFDASKHYFNSIPLDQINLYNAEGGVKLTQNPGW